MYWKRVNRLCIYIWAASETDKIARLLKSDIRRLSVYLIHQLLKYVYIIKKLLQNIISNFRGAKARFHAILLSFLVKALLLKKNIYLPTEYFAMSGCLCQTLAKYRTMSKIHLTSDASVLQLNTPLVNLSCRPKT